MMTLKKYVGDLFIPKLHQISILRAIGKKLFRGKMVRQPFHGGIICLDAVEHSWAWTGKIRYETFDCELQEKLLWLSQDYEMFLDIGCNIGAMTLSVLLRNHKIKAICLDPNSRASALLRESVRINRLADRINIIEAVVADTDGFITFDESGSVMGHVSNSGRQVRSIGFARFINEYSCFYKCLAKVDVEGFETVLMKQLPDLKCRHNLCFVFELHPLHFNEVGNPNHCLNLLLKSGAIVKDLLGRQLNQVEDNNLTQVVVRWPHA